MRQAPRIHDVTRRNVELVSEMEAATKVCRTLGERVADVAARWIGSWAFLIGQALFVAAWIVLNVAGTGGAWDPYPFTLLNLMLSLPAAFATPIILMSQNRQGMLSERRSQLDLQINLLAEHENTKQLQLLRLLCEKMGIEADPDEGHALEEPTEPGEIVRQIDDVVDGRGRAAR